MISFFSDFWGCWGKSFLFTFFHLSSDRRFNKEQWKETCFLYSVSLFHFRHKKGSSSALCYIPLFILFSSNYSLTSYSLLTVSRLFYQAKYMQDLIFRNRELSRKEWAMFWKPLQIIKCGLELGLNCKASGNHEYPHEKLRTEIFTARGRNASN